MDMAEQAQQRQVSRARVIFGLLIMVVGALMLANRFDWGVRLNVPIWPWFLIVLGLVRLVNESPDGKECMSSRRTAAWLVFVGAWGLLTEYRLFGLHYGHSWPLLVVGAGVFMVWRALGPAPRRTRQLHHD
jgi:hypothetical protein